MFEIIMTFLISFNTEALAALEYSKIEHPGCPENAYCQKNTGEVRKKWLDALEDLNKGKITEAKFNAFLQKEDGAPVSGWAMEEAGILPRIMMWDSPCKQHKKDASKFYISELFRKNLNPLELKEINNVYFPKAIGLDANKKVYSMIVPRGEIPTFIENDYYHFLREDDGKYYGLMINREGKLKVTKSQINKELPKDVVCTKEQIDLFLREAPSTTFYETYHCKEIWDKNSKSYKSMLFGWSCN